jgi:hypothetical protein
MKQMLMLGILAATLMAVGPAGAAVDSAAEFLEIVQQRVDRGDLSADQALLLKFQYCFDRDKLPDDLQPTWLAPLKCATPLVMEFLAYGDRLDPATARQIEGYIAEPSMEDRVYYDSPSGRFHISYQTSGGSAVPPADDNANGVPDYVENIGDYLDWSFEYECLELRFKSPPFSASYPYMNITLSALSGVYGFTTPVSQPPGMTRITLDNDFIGFPPNDDPDGNALGAAKVTAAHEFKHSSQYAGSRWSEDGWVEVDATWAEDIVYPETNDYINYLPFGSPISDPELSLDDGGTGSYEDCVWQHYLSETHGVDIIVELWNWRQGHFSQSMMNSYDQMIRDHGSTMREAWNTFSMWNFATGYRVVEGLGYNEGDDYPVGSPQLNVTSYPANYSGYVSRMAANFIRCRSVDSPGDVLRITFNGADTGDMTLAAVVNESYATHVGAMYEISLDANNDAVYDVPYDLGGVYSVGIVVGNGETTGGLLSYSVDLEIVPFDPTSAGDVVPVFAITGNYPNPFNPSTAIEFGLDRMGAVALDIYDLSGRQVRTLLAATLGAGRHTVTWDGRDNTGRGVASGTYVARLRADERLTSHKLVLTK